MNEIAAVLAIIVLVGAIGFILWSGRPKPPTAIANITIPSVITELENTLRMVNEKAAAEKLNLLPLDSADVTLEAGLKQTTEVTAELFVLSGALSHTDGTTHTIELKLRPPK